MEGSAMPVTGQPRARRPRLSDEQTARRVLDAALAQLADRGISVGLDQLGFEDAIRAADVARASAYRRWPTRDAFVEDVLVELAHGAYQPTVGAEVAARAEEVIARYAVQAEDPTRRHDLFVELVRLTFHIDLTATVGSPEFRTYLALRAAFAGIGDPGLRERIAAALATSERQGLARGTAILARAAELFGQRLVPPLVAPEGFEVVARAISAASIGFVVSALTDPGVPAVTRHVAAYGSTRAAAWTVPDFVLTGLVLQHVERDPDAVPLPADELVAGLSGLVDLGAAAAAAAAVPGAPTA
jgi:AcrR family transcriptional regulator